MTGVPRPRPLPARVGHSHQGEEAVGRLRHVRIVGERGHLVLPEVQVASCEFVEIRPLGHGREYNDAEPAWPDKLLRCNT